MMSDAVTANRRRLPNRRENQTVDVKFPDAPEGKIYEITFGFDEHTGRVLECFCSTPKTGSDSQATVNDSCIAISLLLQDGWRLADLAARFGENRGEGADHGPASSILGAMVRAGQVLSGGTRTSQAPQATPVGDDGPKTA